MAEGLIFIGTWGMLSITVYAIRTGVFNSDSKKLKIMSCRRELRKYKLLNDNDKKTLF